MANEVTVLVRFGTRCRLVTFLAEEGYEKLNAAVRKVYSDILSDEQRFFLQIKDEAWGGEFIDVPERLQIEDRSVFKLQLQQQVCLNDHMNVFKHGLYVFCTLQSTPESGVSMAAGSDDSRSVEPTDNNIGGHQVRLQVASVTLQQLILYIVLPSAECSC